mmetsp:Transcript_47965/g.133741  ORF Transcript_47965/g.133741 Transcript_47965/m.133741 type:complete len:219 (-) Transcript_47965:42-698(-)
MCMSWIVPELPLSQLEAESQQRLTYIRGCLVGLWLCACGRWAGGNSLGALNDVFAGIFGACIFQDDMLCLFALQPIGNWTLGGAPCLTPFALLAGLNACFDLLSFAVVCMPCVESTMEAESPSCSGCFFTFGAVVFQISGTILSWQVYRSVNMVFHYADIRAAQQVMVHATGQNAEVRGSTRGALAGTAETWFSDAPDVEAAPSPEAAYWPCTLVAKG